MQPIPTAPALALCLGSVLALSACGGGGAAVKSDPAPPPPPATPPPPPPTPAPVEPCAAPITGGCHVQTGYALTWDEPAMTGGRQSDFGLFVGDGGGYLNLKEGEYRFGGGTTVAGASLVIWDTLISDVEIAHDFTGLGFNGKSELWLTGTVRGNVNNHELLTLRHKCGTALNVCVEDRRSRIEGNYVQGATGTLEAVLGWDLQITGTAALDGKLVLLRGTSQSYVLPTTYSVLVLHAGGGVTGAFLQWRAQGLFLEGELRYTGNDVFLDTSRILVAASMAAAGATDADTLASAHTLDRAFDHADGYVRDAGVALTGSQQQFLKSAASIQHIDDVGRARRSLDSLSGHGYAKAHDALHQHATASAVALEARLARQAYSTGVLAWSDPMAAVQSRGLQTRSGDTGGAAVWVSPRLLVGASVSDGQGAMEFDRMGGRVDGTLPMASVHAHYREGGWYATGQVGAGRSELWTRRTIDIGDAGSHLAQSRRRVDQVFLHSEFGREFAFGAGRLLPFVAFDHSTLRSDGTSEQGATGFELVLKPGRSAQSFASAGVRYALDGEAGQMRWQFDFDARYQRRIAVQGAQNAAFAGTPDVTFDLARWSQPTAAGVVNLGLATGIGRHWTGALKYTQHFGIDTPDRGWFVGLRRDL